MGTIREWLDDLGFQWDRGEILYQRTEDGSPGWMEPISGEMIDANHPILDMEFDNGYGGPECPRFLARDETGVYFPAMYDGSTWAEKIHSSWVLYLGENPEPAPYPGGN